MGKTPFSYVLFIVRNYRKSFNYLIVVSLFSVTKGKGGKSFGLEEDCLWEDCSARRDGGSVSVQEPFKYRWIILCIYTETETSYLNSTIEMDLFYPSSQGQVNQKGACIAIWVEFINKFNRTRNSERYIIA